MSITPIILEWLKKHNIKQLLNTPCGPDLETWKPEAGDEFDAAYINCLFCDPNLPPDKMQRVAQNVASWDVGYLILYDTRQYDWEPNFRAAGWLKLDEKEGPDTELTSSQIWGRAAVVEPKDDEDDEDDEDEDDEDEDDEDEDEDDKTGASEPVPDDDEEDEG